jgi:hypothetical protein
MKDQSKDKNTRPGRILRKRKGAGGSGEVPEGSIVARPEHESLLEHGKEPDSPRKKQAIRHIGINRKQDKGKAERFDRPTSVANGGMVGGSEDDQGKMPEIISVEIYLGTDNPEAITRVVQCVDELVDALGYDGPISPTTERGSFIRHSWAKIKKFLTSDDVNNLMVKTERAIELRYLDGQQAEVDNKVADTLSKLIAALADVPSAFVQVGSILIIKYPGPQGPELRTRQLTQLDLRALERFPEIQREPQKAFESLALALADLTDITLEQDNQ